MGCEIKELDDKYLVLKWSDIRKLPKLAQDYVDAVCLNVHNNRIAEGKEDTRYVVLNLDDDIDLKYLRSRILNAFERPMGSVLRYRVRDIAVDLVNAILKAKRPDSDDKKEMVH